jgi:hypothetical protein
MTHYWDCCKPSCSFENKGGHPIKNCNRSGSDVVRFTDDIKSVCDGGEGSMCRGTHNGKGQYPWVETNQGERILYGYGALTGDGAACGSCFEVKFKNARSIDRAVIMITNGGDSGAGNIDLAVPGGGFGEKTQGCKSYPWKVDSVPSSDISTYGGIHDPKYCDTIFENDSDARRACHEVLWGVFGQVGCDLDAGYPPNLFFQDGYPKKIACPAQLTSSYVS